MPANAASIKPTIVAIGASAGGLEATTQLIAQLSPEVPCSYVVLQHLSPTYRSMMVEILGRETSLEVREAVHGERPQAGTIYVVPSSYNALLREGALHLLTAPPEIVPKPSINQFFISLAAEEGEGAVGIILSGTGSDGVAGLRAIQAAGGITFAQRPETAKYDGMPRAAIDAGVADHVLTPEEIARELPRILAEPSQDADRTSPGLLEQLLSRLHEKLHFDFSGYKLGTLMRRIRRRMAATAVPSLAGYLDWVDAHPHELDQLARDILISVTAFFRDREAFEALRRAVEDLGQKKPVGSEIRVWVAGCATGEEAYSIAMLFAEALGDRLSHFRVQIFATDIDEEALNVARRGQYPVATMGELPVPDLERYFRRVGASYEASKALRDMIVFARHNLVSDPPFLRLDLVSCRNVLIYFDAALQTKVLQTFHFGMADEAFLFLGRSESIAHAENYFRPVERRERLFRKHAADGMPPPPGRFVGTPLRSPAQRRDRTVETLLNGIAGQLGLAALLCDPEGNVQHSVGRVDRYLQFPEGSARLSLTEVAAPALRGELVALLRRYHQTGKPQRGRRRKLGKEWVQVVVAAPDGAHGQHVIVLILPERAPKAEGDAPPAAVTRELEDELLATREHLQALVEEMATANEEMQALNEEAQASNEELQATNEELEAANEELQATNEELVSLNEELNVRTHELAALTEEYRHLYDALQFPILVFDRAFNLVRFNAAAARLFELRTTAARQHLSRLRLVEQFTGLEAILHRALAHIDAEERLIPVLDRIYRLVVTPGLDISGDVATLVASFVDVTDITSTQRALAESQNRLSALMEKTTVIFAMTDLTGAFVYVNERFAEYFGVSVEGLIGKSLFAVLPREVAGSLWALDVESMRRQALVSGETALAVDGQRRVLRSTHQVLADASGAPAALIIEAEDITIRRAAEDQLRITARVFDQAGEAIVVTDAHAVMQTVNAAFTVITGYSAEEAVGRQMRLLKSGRHGQDFYAGMWQALLAKGFWQGEIWNKRKNGEIFPEWLTITRVANDQDVTEHYVSVFSDITDIKDTQRRVEYLATHDTLTALPNRTLFNDSLRHALSQARRSKTKVALLFVDLDNFKNINDTLGHDIGDELLVQVAQRLRGAVRDIDVVARLGGDEFTVVLTDCPLEPANHVAQRIVDELTASFTIQHRTLFASASIGIAFFPDDATDSAGLIKAADSAMYRAKEEGRNRIEYFRPDLHVRLLKHATVESALREALRLERLRLVFQPKFSLDAERRFVGAEALVRWRDPVLGDVSPVEFIPIAEASGLILDLDRTVQSLAVAHIAAWRTAGLDVPPIAVNASPRSVREPDFAGALLSRLDGAEVPHELVQVEITEGALLENSGAVLKNLDALHRAHIGIAVDDFGTGYSSLAYLKRLPLAELKIDRSFVDGLGQDKEDEAIARAMLGLSVALELRAVAEGIENERQLSWLVDHGCLIGQGYHLARPLEVDAFVALLRSGARHA